MLSTPPSLISHVAPNLILKQKPSYSFPFPPTFFAAAHISFCLSNDSKKCVVRTSMRLTECWRPFRRSAGRGEEADRIGGEGGVCKRRRGRDQCRCRFWNPGFPPSVVKASSESCSHGGVSCLIQLPRTQLLHPRASDHRRIIYTQKSDVFSIFHETWPIWEYHIAKISC